MSGRNDRRRSRALATAPLALLATAAAPAGEGRILYVTDGDTFRLESGERIRIAGIDAPGTHADQARCNTEIALGKTAAISRRSASG